MTGPVWDGKGEDPWLPARLAAALDAAKAERMIYRTVWEKLSAWIMATAGRVTRGALMPDPSIVFAEAPAWERSITAIIQESIKPVMGWAYANLLGDGYRWEGRPAVEAYLVGVRNRLARTPNEVFNLITGQIAAAVGLGETIDEISHRVDGVLSTTQTERWPNRAVVIARTETLAALNASRYDAAVASAQETGEQMEKIWLATMDARTRKTHRSADGQRRPLETPFDVGEASLMFPGDPSGPAGEVIQCVPEDTRIEAGSVRAVTRRWFEGEMVRIHFSSGDVLTITPNHPVLGSSGRWTPAGLLNEGDYCVGGTFGGFAVGQPYKYAAPPQIGEIYRAASQSQAAHRVAISPPDFHGDGADCEVQVVPVHGDLSLYRQAATEEEIQSAGFSMSDLATLSLGSRDHWSFTFGVARREVDSLPAALGVRRSGKQATLLGAHAGRAENVRLAGATALQSELLQSSRDGRSTDLHRASNGEHTFAVEVALTKVVKVEGFIFAGHVFNLDTGVGWYIGNGIALKNCRCTPLFVLAGEKIDLTDRQL